MLAARLLGFRPRQRRCSSLLLPPTLRACVPSVYRLPPQFPAAWLWGVPRATCASPAALLVRPRAIAVGPLLSSVLVLLCSSFPSFRPILPCSPSLCKNLTRTPVLQQLDPRPLFA